MRGPADQALRRALWGADPPAIRAMAHAWTRLASALDGAADEVRGESRRLGEPGRDLGPWSTRAAGAAMEALSERLTARAARTREAADALMLAATGLDEAIAGAAVVEVLWPPTRDASAVQVMAGLDDTLSHSAARLGLVTRHLSAADTGSRPAWAPGSQRRPAGVVGSTASAGAHESSRAGPGQRPGDVAAAPTTPSTSHVAAVTGSPDVIGPAGAIDAVPTAAPVGPAPTDAWTSGVATSAAASSPDAPAAVLGHLDRAGGGPAVGAPAAVDAPSAGSDPLPVGGPAAVGGAGVVVAGLVGRRLTWSTTGPPDAAPSGRSTATAPGGSGRPGVDAGEPGATAAAAPAPAPVRAATSTAATPWWLGHGVSPATPTTSTLAPARGALASTRATGRPAEWPVALGCQARREPMSRGQRRVTRPEAVSGVLR